MGKSNRLDSHANYKLRDPLPEETQIAYALDCAAHWPHWHAASNPPDGEVEKWSRDVIVMTSLGHVRVMAYFHGREGVGVWQRPTGMLAAEHPEVWTNMPEL